MVIGSQLIRLKEALHDKADFGICLANTYGMFLLKKSWLEQEWN